MSQHSDDQDELIEREARRLGVSADFLRRIAHEDVTVDVEPPPTYLDDHRSTDE